MSRLPIRNSGTDAQDEWENLMKKIYRKQLHIYRVTDSAEVRGMAGSGFTKPQPSDYVVTAGGRMFYAEVKSSNNPTSFPFKDITLGQKAAAKKQVAANGEYFFYIKNMTIGRWYEVPAQIIFNVIEAGHQSIKWSVLEENFQWMS